MSNGAKLSKWIQTILIFEGFLLIGINNTILGPTLLDLQIFLHEPHLDTLFIVNGVGSVLGGCLAIWLPQCPDLRLQLGAITLFAAACGMLTCLVPNFIYFCTFYLSQSICKGFIISYSFQLCNGLWTRKDVVMQFVIAGATLGGLITPLVAEPVLALRQNKGDERDLMSTELDDCFNNRNYSIEFGALPNASEANFDRLSILRNNSVVKAMPTLNCFDIPCASVANIEHSNVRWVFFLLALIPLPSGLGMLLFWLLGKNDSDGSHASQTKYENLEEVNNNYSKVKRTIIIVSAIMFSLASCGLLITYSSSMTVFGVKGPLCFCVSTMLRMTSCLFVGSFFGKLCNSLLTKLVGVAPVITINLCLALVVEVLILMFVINHPLVMWICTFSFGVFASPFQGAVVPLVSEYITLTPRIISSITLSFGFGILILPYASSCMMRRFWPLGHFIFILALTIIMVISFVIVLVVGESMRQNDSRKRDNSVP